MRRLLAVTSLTTALVVGIPMLGNAGGNAGDFEIDPDSGTAGQAATITASDDIPVCQNLSAAGIVVLGTFFADVEVTLWNPGKVGPPIDQETVQINIGDDWEATLQMPSGKPAGSYPVSARCLDFQGQPFATYNDQIFVLRAASRRAVVVETEVSFTG